MIPRLLTYKVPKQIPQRLIYKVPLEDTYIYKMADTKTGKYVGRMIGNISQEFMDSSFYPSLESYKSFFIRILNLKSKREGHGSSFIKLAYNESRQNGGGGKIHLIASSCFEPKASPHVFYRKLGFTSRYSESIKIIDKAIKNKKNLSYKDIIDIPMYLPDEAIKNFANKSNVKQNKTSVWQRIKNLFK